MSKWTWILLGVVVIIIVIYFINKNNSTKEIPNAVQNLVNNSGLGNIISTPNTPATPAIITSGFKFGDKIYARENGVNTYKSASASSGNLASFKGYDKDQFIGTFLAKESIYTKILIASPASSVYSLTSQIYSK